MIRERDQPQPRQAPQPGFSLRRTVRGLYSSHLVEWRRLRETGALGALSKKRGRKLNAELVQVKKKLRQAEIIIDVPKKVSALLAIARFVDQAPHQVHATLLDEGIYVCSPRTMCRLLEEHGELRERRDQLRPPANSTSTPATDRTMKYRPEFPDRFGSLEDARAHGHGFFHWYNLQHHHSGIAMLTPHMVHYGLAADVLDNRQRVLTAAFQQHPECFVRKPPRPAPLPHAVWINPPKPGPPEGGETH